jgi:hypothetical protein
MPHVIDRIYAIRSDDPPIDESPPDPAALAAKAVADLEEELKILAASLVSNPT